MIELALGPNAILFAIMISLMVISAGVASFPPARDFRVFLGAAIMGGAWFAAIAAGKSFDSWAITSGIFVLDFVCIAAFYRISKPKPGDPDGAVTERNWAGYVAGILALLIVVEFAHALATTEFGLRSFVIVLLGAVSVIVFWGFARGFGYRAAIIFALILVAINLIGMNFFLTASNSLTAIAFGIIIWRALRGGARNFRAWTQRS